MGIFRKNGNWYIDYYCDLVRFRQKIGPSRKQAEQAHAIKLSEIVQGTFKMVHKRKRMPFSMLTEKYLEYSQANKRSYKRDLSIMKNLSRYFGNRTVEQIDSHMIELYKIQRRNEIMQRKKYQGKNERDIPLTAINRELACLKRMYNLAIEWGKTERNPVRGVKFFKKDNLTERILSKEEIDRLLDSSHGIAKDIIIMALNTGMRLGGILSLRWEQVDLMQGYLTIIHKKTGNQRKIPINDSVRSVLEG